jgi:hypothetical protein
MNIVGSLVFFNYVVSIDYAKQAIAFSLQYKGNGKIVGLYALIQHFGTRF